MLKKIGSDIYDTKGWGNKPVYKKAEGRILKWLLIFLVIGLLVGFVLAKVL